MSKYFKPKSVTWWSGVIPLAAGIFLALEPIHLMSDYVAVVREIFGNVTPGVLINGGLAAIGLRGAVK